VNNLQVEIIKFFLKKGDVNDDDFHAFCEENGIDPHEAETEVYKMIGSFINAGNYKDLDFSTIDMNEFKMGIKFEMEEHTENILFASKIALDHLQEDSKYYTKLSEAKL